MDIDIISYTAEQFAALTTEQILEVRSAQAKKNALNEKLAEDLAKEKARLIGNGMMHSGVWDKIQGKLEDACQKEIALLRDSLLFYLHYSAKPEEDVEAGNPYPLDYSLSETERYLAVKAYYEGAYADGAERFAAFKADAVAKQYLGELYATLYDVFLESA